MIFVDTGYLLAVARPRDQLHARARAWSVSNLERLLTTEYVLLEFFNASSDVASRAKAHAIVNGLDETGCEIVPASAHLWLEGKTDHARFRDKEWSLTDCLSFVVMRERRINQALAHDHHFEQAGFVALLLRDP